ncbi:transmembrane amino acid transporter protein-domain-containing protein [Entophlyctis helioformis]|nr:transmembrane amino acid transporter protein-domain-containing protein [Entophlyctis helioformis]
MSSHRTAPVSRAAGSAGGAVAAQAAAADAEHSPLLADDSVAFAGPPAAPHGSSPSAGVSLQAAFGSFIGRLTAGGGYAPLPTAASTSTAASAPAAVSVGASHIGNGNDDNDDVDVDDDGRRSSAARNVAHRVSESAPTGTVLSSSINITNTILGAGMLAMPFAMATVGLGLGILFVCISATASGLGLFLLSRVAAQVGRKSSFFACAKITYPHAALWIDLAIAIKCFGVSVSYLVICGDLMPQVSQGLYAGTLLPTDLLLSKKFWITVSILAIAPVTFLRRLDSLRYTSAFALMAVVYLVYVVLVFYASPPATGMPLPPPTFDEIEWFKPSTDIFTTLPIFVFAFTCHQNIFSVYNELVDNRPPKIEQVIRGSILTSVAVYQFIGVVGYLTFGRHVASNIIAMYPAGNLVTCGQFAIVLLVLLSYPLQCHPGRACLDKVVSTHLAAATPASTATASAAAVSTSFTAPGHIPTRRFVSLTVGLLVASYLVAVSVSNLSTILSLVGATGSTMIAYILPGLFYYRLRRNAQPLGAPLEPLERVAVVLAGFGGVVMVSSLLTQFWNLASGAAGGAGGGH